MRKVRTRPWDAADYLKTDADIDAYLDAALEDGDPQLITAALGDIAKARGMTKVAADIGCSRESLYKALSANGNPLFATVLKTVNALGLRLRLGSSAVPWLQDVITADSFWDSDSFWNVRCTESRTP
ncbi:MAG: putative addiction module antidote protein [Caldilineaceae bacterium]|nr:putative addiction module antidote protein [Caldilineaceae bacterium]